MIIQKPTDFLNYYTSFSDSYFYVFLCWQVISLRFIEIKILNYNGLSIYNFFESKRLDNNDGFGYNGVVASENKICSDIGVDIMKNGGSAVDSAIASCLCLGTVNFFASGIGGGGFMVIRSDKGEYVGIDFRHLIN